MSFPNARASGPATASAFVLALTLSGPAGCPREDAGARVAVRLPNVILIIIDTLRADHLGCYGYELPTSPRIDAFAQTATLFTRSYATSAWTIPTHASLFTGKFPFEHGAHTFEVSEPTNNVSPLPREHLTLAEALRREGYATGAFVANAGYLGTRWQLDQGFEIYHVERVYARELNQRVVDWLRVDGDKRFFLFINYIDTHRPYNTTPRRGLLNRPVVGDSRRLLNLLSAAVMPLGGSAPLELVQKVIDQYDTAIANVDEQIGALLDELVAMGLYDDAMIVVTSDHGEFFGEHGLVEHSKDVYQEVLRVPLIIKDPGQRVGRLENTLVSSTDLPHLISSQLPGGVAERCRAVFSDAPGSHLVISENYFTRPKDLFHPKWGRRFWRVRTAVFDWPYKYIHSSDGQNELYHLVEDPGESSNLIEQRAEVADRLARELGDFQLCRHRWEGRVDTGPYTEEEREQLRSLGYIEDADPPGAQVPQNGGVR